MIRRHFIILTIIVFAGVLTTPGVALAAREPSASSPQPIVVSGEGAVMVNPTPSTILAPQGLSTKDQAQLEQQYRYEFKGKNTLLSPYIQAGGAGGGGDEGPGREQQEQEKLYRYFGAAMGLYEQGRLDEAVDILRHISEKNPDDEYIKSYLNRLLREKAGKDKKWADMSKSDAAAIKKQQVSSALKDGMSCYNQGRFDDALLKFSDVLALDPGNSEASRYMSKLKERYLKEVQVENIVENYENGFSAMNRPEDRGSVSNGKGDKPVDSAKGMLDAQETKTLSAVEKELNKKESPSSMAAIDLLSVKEGEMKRAAEKALNDKEFESIIEEKRLNSVMDQAELGITIEDIVTQKRLEDRKKNQYTLGPGDVIQISVRDHPELSGRGIVVKLGGIVVLPLVNEVVKIKGLTDEEAAAAIKEAMKRYVRDPYVTVSIEEYRSKTFYVVDEIGCTPYPITRANLTLRDALFIADWGDNRALGRVIVLKPDRLHPVVRKIDTFDIIYRGKLENNIRIEDGDVIYIPLTIAAKVTKTIADTIQPFAAVNRARNEWLNLKGDIKSWKELPKMRQDATTQGYQDFMWWPNNINSGTI